MEAQMALFEKSSPGLLVETLEGPSFTVSSDCRTCSCGIALCAHSSFVQRLVPDSSLKWVLVSAMHKELRRGDVRKALSWGYWLSVVRSPAKVRSYLRAIVFEETRSLALYLAARREKRWEAIIPMFAATRKKWEVSSRAGLDARLLRQWALPGLEDVQLFEWAQSSTDIDQLYKVVCDAWKKPPMTKYQIAKILGARGGVESISEENFNGLCFLAEKVAGVLGDDAEFVLPYESANLEEASQYVPPVMDYVYDPHTMEGRKRIKAAFSDIRPGVPLPVGIDLRWSGASVGFAWRSLAVVQLGLDRYKDARWEDVQYPESVWNDAVKADTDWGLIL